MYRALLTLSVLFIFPLSLSAQNERIDSLRTHINPAIMESQTVESIAQLSGLLIRNSDLEEAREWLVLGFEVAERIDDNDGRFAILAELGNYYLKREDPDSATVMLLEAEPFAQTPQQKGVFHELRASAYSMNGMYVLSVEQLERATFIADSLGNSEREAWLKMKSAEAWSALGDHTEALRAYYDGLEYAEQVKDSALIAAASNLVGWKFLDLNNPGQGEYFLLRSEEISRANNFDSNLTGTLLNLGNLYRELGDFEKAENYYSEAVELAGSRGEEKRQIQVFYNLGLMERKRGNYTESRRLLLYALDESREIGDVEIEYYSASGLGSLEMELGNNVQAIRWFARANNTVDNERYTLLKLASYENLYRAYRETGNFSESLKWLELRDRLNDSLNTSEKSRLLAEYETLFNVKQTRQQSEILRAREEEAQTRLRLQQWIIVLAFAAGGILLVASIVLVRANEKRKKTNDELQSSNRQLNEMNATVQEQNEELEQINDIKNKLFAIIAHDLRGPLSSLQSLLYLIRDHNLSQDEMNEISRTLERSLQENASMMDNLLAWAQAQMNGIQLHERDFPLYQGVKSVTDQIKFQADKKGIDIKADVHESIEVKADYDMIKLVVRNLIANAIKFSKKGDTITVKALYSATDGMAEVRVTDEGIGMKEEDQKKLFSKSHFTKRGTDNEKGSGLGLMLCKEFIESHGGKLWFESKFGAGTTFKFTIPLSTSAECEKDSRSAIPESDIDESRESPVLETGNTANG